ncbi:MAG: hypothetical protein KDD10_04465, partial [Phaeodactylibacter sp.]|nr:hypothetical protein [Phaeodactylibacter sp.]
PSSRRGPQTGSPRKQTCLSESRAIENAGRPGGYATSREEHQGAVAGSQRLEWPRNLILLGDFNIYAPTDQTLTMITDAGFTVPPELQRLPSNIQQNKFYDQIAFRVRPGRFSTTGKAGVFNYYKTVFTLDDEKLYVEEMGPAYLKTSDGQARKTA